MAREYPLCAAFLSVFESPAQGDDPRVLEPALQAFLDAARGQRDLTLRPEILLPYVAARCPAEVDLVAHLGALHAADFGLVCACVQRDPRALSTLDRDHLCRLEAELRRTGLAPTVSQDALQSCRERLLVGDGVRGPRLSEYNGTSALWSWLRVVALREALQLLRKTRRETSLPEAILNLVAPASDPELLCLKQTYLVAFKEAFARAVASLSGTERTLLRQNFVYGLTIDALGTLHGVHRATAARWLQRIRDQLLKRTKDDLVQRLLLSETEFDGVLSLIRSQLDLSLNRHLGPADD